jgi:hypothetical protein
MLSGFCLYSGLILGEKWMPWGDMSIWKQSKGVFSSSSPFTSKKCPNSQAKLFSFEIILQQISFIHVQVILESIILISMQPTIQCRLLGWSVCSSNPKWAVGNGIRTGSKIYL